MLICSPLFVCEHLFTFKFSALMPKISKENFAGILKIHHWLKSNANYAGWANLLCTEYNEINMY